MQTIVTTVLPIFAIILCGFLAGRFRVMPNSGAGALNAFVYYFALPALLFSSLAGAPVSRITDFSFLAANTLIAVSSLGVTFLISFFVFKKRFPDLALHGMAASFGNTGFLGIPFLITAFGQEAAVPAALATFIYDIIILTTVIVAFEISRARKNNAVTDQESSPLIWSVSKSILLDPVNGSLLLGLLVAFSGIPLPEPAFVFTDILGSAAGPTALFALGLGLVNENHSYRLKNFLIGEISTLIGLKLVFQPLAAAFFVFYLFPLPELETMAVILLASTPTGALVYVFAERYRTFEKEAPIIILFSTILSIFTLSLVLLLLEIG